MAAHVGLQRKNMTALSTNAPQVTVGAVPVLPVLREGSDRAAKLQIALNDTSVPCCLPIVEIAYARRGCTITLVKPRGTGNHDVLRRCSRFTGVYYECPSRPGDCAVSS